MRELMGGKHDMSLRIQLKRERMGGERAFGSVLKDDYGMKLRNRLQSPLAESEYMDE
jgi:hypothetical protein